MLYPMDGGPKTSHTTARVQCTHIVTGWLNATFWEQNGQHQVHLLFVSFVPRSFYLSFLLFFSVSFFENQQRMPKQENTIEAYQ